MKYKQKNNIEKSVFDVALASMETEQQERITDNTERMVGVVRNLGRVGALELIARLGMHLVTGEADLRKLPYLLKEE